MSTESIYNSIASTASQEAALAELSPSPDTAAQLRADLSSGSRVSVWRLFAWLFAYASSIQEASWWRYKKDVADLSRDGHYGTQWWYIAKAKAFQLGHTLVMTSLDGGYAADDPGARIVTHAAVAERANLVQVKVAKGTAAPLQKLTPEELAAVNDYFQHLRPTVQVQCITADPDSLKITGTVVYDPETPIMAVQSAVKQSLDTYLSTLDFGGVLRVQDLRAAIMSAQGVVDVVFGLVEARSTGPFRPVQRLYHSYAGHMQLDPYSSIISTITWQQGRI
ncbi:MAG: baseplate J/gp47 family protein [Bacteroidetes bacterium]|nr:baseplate J/gp47 family protein [Bacteroidota bacterium]